MQCYQPNSRLIKKHTAFKIRSSSFVGDNRKKGGRKERKEKGKRERLRRLESEKTLGRIKSKVDICQTDYSIHFKLRIFLLFWSHTWKCNIQASKKLTKVKEKWSSIKFDVFILSFILFILMSQNLSAIHINRVCYFLLLASNWWHVSHASNGKDCPCLFFFWNSPIGWINDEISYINILFIFFHFRCQHFMTAICI